MLAKQLVEHSEAPLLDGSGGSTMTAAGAVLTLKISKFTTTIAIRALISLVLVASMVGEYMGTAT